MVLFLVQGNPFFWDTIQLGSKHAHFFYENQFSKLWLPDLIDSGHPPVFGAYLALCWSLFGKSLIVSHWAMLPFLLGVGWLALKIGAYFTSAETAPWFLAFLLADPVWMGQAVLVSPDVCLVTFFLWGIWAICSDSKWGRVVAGLGLAMISTRGMMVVVALYVFELWRQSFSLKSLFLSALPYVPAGLFALAFLIGHYLAKGWIGYHADSPWAPGFTQTVWAEVPKQMALYAWRMLDFGRLFLWVVLLLVLWRGRKNWAAWPKWQEAIKLGVVCLCLLSITFFAYKNLNNHRYLLPIFTSLSLLTIVGSHYFLSNKQRFWAYLIVIIGLAFGNLWVYPNKVSQAWDCTLGHLPHYQLRAEMLAYLAKADIPLVEVGTAFPERGPLKFKDLSNRTDGFKEKDLEKDTYILYSNVMNDFSDAEIDALFQEWGVVNRMDSYPLFMILFERKQ